MSGSYRNFTVEPGANPERIYEALDSSISTLMEKATGLEQKAKALVDLMDDAERNHGSLVGAKTLRGVNELRLELSKWK